MAFYSQKTHQFGYFAKQLNDTDWSDKDILDFGGNIGNILQDPQSTIHKHRYWCLDVDSDAIKYGKQLYPGSHWRHYDRHSHYFNPRGTPGLPLPEMGQTFDYIVAYSVFTNTLLGDMLDLVDQLQALLKESGKLAFTFIDPHYRSWPGQYAGSNLCWRLEQDNPRMAKENRDSILEQASGSDWCILVNGCHLYTETDEITYAESPLQSCHTHVTVRHMRTLYPDATIQPPTNGEMQHCCIVN